MYVNKNTRACRDTDTNVYSCRYAMGLCLVMIVEISTD